MPSPDNSMVPRLCPWLEGTAGRSFPAGRSGADGRALRTWVSSPVAQELPAPGAAGVEPAQRPKPRHCRWTWEAHCTTQAESALRKPMGRELPCKQVRSAATLLPARPPRRTSDRQSQANRILPWNHGTRWVRRVKRRRRAWGGVGGGVAAFDDGNAGAEPTRCYCWLTGRADKKTLCGHAVRTKIGPCGLQGHPCVRHSTSPMPRHCATRRRPQGIHPTPNKPRRPAAERGAGGVNCHSHRRSRT
jgi:hypothetical protein